MVSVFLKAAILTVIILFIGIQLGIWIDTSRVEEIKGMLTETELQFIDANLQSLYYENFPSRDFCESALKANLDYNERIYQQGLKIERYEIANKFTPELLLERKRYALLQFQFWMNAVKLKKTCEFNYTTLLHLWKYQVNDYNTELNQKLQSAVLIELKEKCGANLMLSNTPTDLNLTSIDMIVRGHDITEMPSIIIDENITLQGFQTSQKLEGYVKC